METFFMKSPVYLLAIQIDISCSVHKSEWHNIIYKYSMGENRCTYCGHGHIQGGWWAILNFVPTVSEISRIDRSAVDLVRTLS